jgi:hypothetical protein
MPERPNGAVSKTVVSSNGHRGFKSHSLRQDRVRGTTLQTRPYGIDSGFRDPSGNSIGLTQVREMAGL